MKVLSIVLVLLSISFSAQAGTDYTCVNDCTRRGYMYNLCVERCTYGSQPSQNSGPQWYNPIETQNRIQELEAAKLRNQQMQLQIQQQKEEALKRQRILDLQLEEAEAKAVERRQKRLKEQEPEKDDEYN